MAPRTKQPTKPAPEPTPAPSPAPVEPTPEVKPDPLTGQTDITPGEQGGESNTTPAPLPPEPVVLDDGLGDVPPAGDAPSGEVPDVQAQPEAVDATVAPDARIAAAGAPLEAPAPPKVVEVSQDEDPDAPQPAGNLGAALVKNAVPGSRLIDNATGKVPDPETLFVPVEGPGVMVQCTIRLCQETWIGPHENPIVQLVMPQTQVTGPEKAAQILAVLREQIERDAAELAGDDAEAGADSE